MHAHATGFSLNNKTPILRVENEMEICSRELNLERLFTEIDDCLFSATRVYIPSFMTLKNVICIET